MKTIHYEITEPCTQDWNQMKEVPGGRFCEHCSKKVHDLTNGNIFVKEGNFCVRILKPKKISFGRMLFTRNPWLYVQLFFILLANNIRAQVQKLTAGNLELQLDLNDTTQRTLVLSGTIIDSTTNEPVPFARGLVFDSEKKIIAGLNTDVDGKFVFTFFHRTGTDTSVNLKVTREGYRPLEVNDIPLYKKSTSIKLPMDSLLATKRTGRCYQMGGLVATVQGVYDGVPAQIDLSQEKSDPESFERLHGQAPGIRTRFDNTNNNR